MMQVRAKRPRLSIVASHPIQHFCPLYRALAADGRLDLKVFFASDAGKTPYYDQAFARHVGWGDDITQGFDHQFLAGSAPYDIGGGAGSRNLAKELGIFDPDVVQLYGYRSKLSRQALFWAKLNGRPSLMVGDSELLSPRSLPSRMVKYALLQIMFRIPTRFLTVGDENERYYAHYGVSPERMSRSPIPIDSPLFDKLIDSRDALRTKLREAWGAAAADVVFLVVGKTVPHKSPDHVLKAMAAMPPTERARALVVFAGGGPGSPELEILSGALGVRSLSAGFLSVPDLVAAYLGADVLVHPSARDAHPLAVAEGVYAGLPVVLSDRVGSWGPTDDVRPGQNGLRYVYGDIIELSGYLTNMVRDTALREQLSRASWRIGRGRGIASSVASYVDAALQVANVD